MYPFASWFRILTWHSAEVFGHQVLGSSAYRCVVYVVSIEICLSIDLRLISPSGLRYIHRLVYIRFCVGDATTLDWREF